MNSPPDFESFGSNTSAWFILKQKVFDILSFEFDDCFTHTFLSF